MEIVDIEKLKTFLASRVTMMTDYDDGIAASRIDEYIDEFLESQPIQPEPHWIPCSERLPEKNGEYLCQEKLGFLYVDTWNGEYWDCADRAFGTVVAWMPLPEPWEGE